MIRTTALHFFCRTFSIPRLSKVTQHSFVHPGPRPTIGIPRNFSSSRPTRAIYYVRFGGDPKPKSGKESWIGHKEQWIIGLSIFGIVYYVSHLEQVPETGRWRFMNISRKFENEIGEMIRNEILEENANKILPPNHIVSQGVKRIVSRILSASNLGQIRGSARDSTSLGGIGKSWGEAESTWDSDSQRPKEYQSETPREWEVVVVNEPRILNAMAAPGVIVVFTGLLQVTKDEHGLASVLAHEIGHVAARHTAEKISSQSLYLVFLTLVNTLVMDLFGLTNVVCELLLKLPNSRTMEYEADKIGLKLMSRACYDPKGAVEMFSRLERLESEKSMPDFFHTHPSNAKRVEELSKLLPEAYDVLYSNPDCAAVHAQLMDLSRRFNVPRKSFHDKF